ncbi:hypothetical protein [Natronocalculus amylovorans]|uniref:Uncharacterized protein n=1 Tax=Natronocalculus amylovorans TaxID=2917812 RepID=A0AAE3G1E6_9EURY|nr:hypothetical protein [Natronocalculus amylovorans]MCL9818435.1 hypothetical protein [Natronocalculus amylovorans]
MSALSSFYERIHQPEYTGENRCLPCTAVNIMIAGALTVAVAIISPLAAVPVVAGSLAAIYVRGYLVPGTPELTKRYLPTAVLELFGKAPEDTETWETIERMEYAKENAINPEEFLIEVGAVEPCMDGMDICLTESFAGNLADRFETYRSTGVSNESLAALFDVSEDDLTIEDRSYPAVTVNRRVQKWPGDAALIADVSTHELLSETTAQWGDVPLSQRLNILKSLRSFHELCPACGGEISIGSTTAESCCHTYEIVAVECGDCTERLLELDPEVIESAPTDSGITA